MSDLKNKKVDLALSELLNRQDYLVTQANELARSFGNLKTFEHKVLDYCFSFVSKDDNRDKIYELNFYDLIRHLGLYKSGTNYARIAKAFKQLNQGTAIYLRTTKPDGRKGILMTHLFDYIEIIDDGKISFRFGQEVAPYIFHLKERFYSFKLSELSRVRSKYTITLLKLWNANAFGKWRNYNDPNSLPPSVTIQGSLEDWQSWFLGSNENGKPKKWPAGRFKQMVLNVATTEIAELYPNTLITLTTLKNGRKVAGYKLDIHSVQTNLDMSTVVIDGKPQVPRKK